MSFIKRFLKDRGGKKVIKKHKHNIKHIYDKKSEAGLNRNYDAYDLKLANMQLDRMFEK